METNTMNDSEFNVLNAIFILLGWVIYQVLFRCYGYRTLLESEYILFVTVTSITYICMCFERKHYKNSTAVIFNVILGYGTYHIMTYYPFRHYLIHISIQVAFIFILILSILLLCKRIKNKENKGEILKQRLSRIGIMAHHLIGVAFAFIMLISLTKYMYSETYINADVQPRVNQYATEEETKKMKQTLIKLEDSTWNNLSIKERLNVLQTIVNLEVYKLGIPTEIHVGVKDLDEVRLAYYRDKTHHIVIDTKGLSKLSSSEAVKTICHETYHAYQERLVDLYNNADADHKNLYLFEKAKIYKEEFENYTDAREDLEEYYYQNCEFDARMYGEEETVYYESFVNSLLKAEKSGN